MGTGRLSSRLSRESVVASVSSERFACFLLMFKKLCGNLVLQFSFCVLDTVRWITRRKSQMDSVSKAITFSDRKSFSFFQVGDGSRADFGSTLGFLRFWPQVKPVLTGSAPASFVLFSLSL